MEKLAKIKELINTLDFEEQLELDKYFTGFLDNKEHQLVHEALETVKKCPHCGKSKIIQWGNYKGQKRYKCQKCERTFTPSTGSVLHCLNKKQKFIKYLILMFYEDFNDLKTLAKRIGISVKTAFDWRHRILIALRTEAPDLKGIVEMDDLWFLYSQKGRKDLKYSRKRGGSSRKGDNNFQAKVLVTKERENFADMSLVKIGRLSKVDISRRLSGKIKKTSILVSDKHASIASFAKSESLKHESFIAKTHVKDKIYHVQTVNYMAGALDTRINRWLRGVSTKYLQNYVTWFAILDNYKKVKNKIEKIITLCISNKNAWNMFTNIEKLYEQFILEHSKRTYRCPTKKHWKSQYWNLENAKSGFFL